MPFIKQAVALAALLCSTVSGQGFGLGYVPQMGWSSWYTYGCDISADKIKK